MLIQRAGWWVDGVDLESDKPNLLTTKLYGSLNSPLMP
jgi:hypothetical protein